MQSVKLVDSAHTKRDPDLHRMTIITAYFIPPTLQHLVQNRSW